MALPSRLLEEVLQASSDPPPARALRLLRVARAIGLGDEWPAARLRPLLRVALRHGISVRALHGAHASLHPDRPALVDAAGSRTYAEVDAEIDRVASGLARRLGLGRGGALVLATENRAEYVVAWFAHFRLGARAVHASWRATAAELGWLIDHSGARALLVSPPSLAAAREARDARPGLGVRLVVCGAAADGGAGELTWDELVEAGDGVPAPPRAEGGGSVVYTSGTTGRPKGAVRDFNAFGLRELARVLERLPFHVGERHLVVAPLYHSAPQVFALLTTALGGTLHLHPHFDAAATAAALAGGALDSVFLVPTMLKRVLEAAPAASATSALRAVVVGSSEFPAALREAAIRRFGAEAVFDFYGATELGWVTLARGDEMLARPGTVGRPLAGQRVRILDGEGRALPPGEVGLVHVRNEQTMLGYLGDEAASRATRNGPWVTVDDLGRLDGDGYLYLAGRARDLVKSGGVNLYPAEIEAALAQDPEVAEVAVIGVPDPEWGERLVAVVVPRRRPFDASAAEARARRELSAPKVPRRWELVDELPRNANGKVLKAELRARFRT